jgi:hypothetical protein
MHCDCVVRLTQPLQGGAGPAGEPCPVSVVFVSADGRELGRDRGEWSGAAPHLLRTRHPAPAGTVAVNVLAAAGPSWSALAVGVAAPGRVYGVDRNHPTERFGGDVRPYTHTGARIPVGVFRIEFDDDADEGLATVSFYVLDSQGKPVIDPERNEPVLVRSRMWLRVAPKGEAVPLTPDAVLYRGAGGRIVRMETDPLPDDAIRAAGGTVEEEVKQGPR